MMTRNVSTIIRSFDGSAVLEMFEEYRLAVRDADALCLTIN